MSKIQKVLNWLNQKGETLGFLRQFNPLTVRGPLAISSGAIAGALSRYYLTLGCNRWLGTAFPFATFFVNLSGAFVMGFFITLAVEKTTVSPDVRLAIAVGFLGSYTTFSSYQLEAEKLLIAGHWENTILYWIGSAILGVLFLEIGTYIARRLP